MDFILSLAAIAMTVLSLANMALAGPFSISADRQLKVDWNGKSLITTDRIDCVGPDTFKAPEGSKNADINGWAVHNVWQMKGNGTAVTYRREVAVNDRAVELTIQFRVPSYYQRPHDALDTYTFSVPVKALEGMNFQAITGRTYAPEDVTGKITTDLPDGPVIRAASFIAFEGDGRHLVFDLNPKGLQAWNDSEGNSVLAGTWTITKSGNRLDFSVGRGPIISGAIISSKIRIVEGTFADYSKWHAHRSYSYFGQLPVIQQLTMAAGAGDKTLEVNVPEPGIYFFTIRNNLAATGPFALVCNGQTVATNVLSSAGKMQTITFSRYAEGKQIKLSWHGKWAASSVAVQALIYKAEDYAFQRSVWLADDIPTPATFFMFKRTMPPALGWVYDNQARTTPYPAAQLKAARLPAGEVNVPAPDDPNRAWRWDGNIGGLSSGNFDNFYEFDTDELINRRLNELQHQGYRIILLNGLLVRHAWAEQLPRVQKTMKRIVELAHQRGMKVLDHQDISIVCYQDAGFNQLVDHLDWTQRDVRSGVPTLGWCLNNVDFQKHYFKYITDWVKNTGVDGVMIDETGFHGEMFCGCEYCRAQFHKETGLYLPYSGQDLLNRKSRLWKLWLKWRIKSIGDWHVKLRQHLETVNPNIVIMKYTTDYGLMSDDASIKFGDTLADTARAVDFLGTEIQSRNLWATFRSNLAARRAFNSLRHAFGTPIFGLVYSIGQPVFAYSGWIQNNMNAQVTWAMTGYKHVEEDAGRYLNWKENMDPERATPVGRTAVVFSRPSIDFPVLYGVGGDTGWDQGYAMQGVVEQLGDAHIPHQVILGRDLTPASLKKFSLLILPAVGSMSDDAIAAVHDFLLKGGNVLALGHTGVADELGDMRKTWPIGSWIGLKFDGKLSALPVTLDGKIIGESPLDFPEAVISVSRDPRSRMEPEILAHAKAGGQSYIAIAKGKVGKGTLIIATPRLGEANCELETTIDETWNYQYNARIGDLFANLVKQLMSDRPVFKAVQIPTAVRTSVYRQPEGDGKTMTLVHLYNGTGVHMKVGEKVGRAPSADPFPALKQDIIFEVSLPTNDPVRADLVSPDFNSARAIGVQSIGDRRYRVTVNKDDLKAYAIVRLR